MIPIRTVSRVVNKLNEPDNSESKSFLETACVIGADMLFTTTLGMTGDIIVASIELISALDSGSLSNRRIKCKSRPARDITVTKITGREVKKKQTRYIKSAKL